MECVLKKGTGLLPRKRGFALLITLSVLLIVMMLTGVLVTYLDQARKEASKESALIQANLYYAQLKQMLHGLKERKRLYALLYQKPLPLLSEDSTSPVLIKCRPLHNVININWLFGANDPLMYERYTIAQKVYDTVAQEYEINDPELLERMLQQSGDRMVHKDIQGRLRENHAMISYQMFVDVLTRYQFRTGDDRVSAVPWRRLFGFQPVSRNGDGPFIDGNYLSVELLSMLFHLDKDAIKEEWQPGEGALKHLSAAYGFSYRESLFADDLPDTAQCSVWYGYRDKQYRFRFTDNDGEVKDFEFDGQQ